MLFNMNYFLRITFSTILLALTTFSALGQCDNFTATANNVVDATCFGAGTGSAVIQASNGTAPYQYTLELSGAVVAGPSMNNIFSGLISGNYTFIVTDAMNCVFEGNFQILQPADPQVFISGLGISYCQDGDPAFLIGTPQGGTFTGLGVVGNQFDPSIAGQGFHTVTYTYTDPNGCIYYAYQAVEVGLPTEFNFYLPDFFCQTDTSGYAINVSPAGGTLLGPGIADNGLFYPAQAGAGTHTLNYYYFDGTCFNIVDTELNVSFPLPIFGYSVSGMTTVSFIAPPGLDTYNWSFGDGSISSQPNPNYSYASTGSYAVCLTVTEDGCQGIYCDQLNLTSSTLIPEFDYTIFSTTIVFDDNSLGATSWYWDFGNGFTSTLENPIHNFVLEGVYEVCLTVSNGTDTLTNCQYINIVCPIPEADYFYATNGLVLNTSNISINGTEFLWDFGDGTTSYFFDPIHSYAYEGIYDVCLTAANNCGANQLCKEVWIVCPAPEVSFSYEADNYTISFTSNVSGASAMTWNFGDGISSNNPNPVHTFSEIDNYVVCLEAINDCGTTLECIDLFVDCLVPDAEFTYDASLLTVNFNSGDTNADSYLWNFGNMNYSTVENPSFTFDSAGTYTVCLETTNECGTDNHCEVFDLSCLPTAEFLFASADLTLFITSNTSQNATSFLWDFGNGVTSTDFTPIYTYDIEGSYDLCLTSSNDCGSITICEEVNIVCPLPVADFTYSIDDLVVSFTAINPQGLITYDFGDGVISNIPEIEHIYQAQGNFLVCMSSETECGIDSLCQEVIINCPPPNANFQYELDGSDITLSASNGPFQNYVWTLDGDTISLIEEPSITITIAAEYDFCLIIDNACGQSTVCQTIFIDPCLGFEIVDVLLTDPTCFDASNGVIEVILNPDYEDAQIVITGGSPQPGPGYGAGWYYITATNSQGCESSMDSVLLQSPDELIMTYVAENPDCIEGLLGSLTINGTGGIPPFSYSIDSGLNYTQTNVFNELGPNVYDIMVLDANGCVFSETFILEGSGDIDIVIIDITPDSNGSMGAIDITINGGVGPYNFEWSTGDVTEDINGLAAGSYTVLVTDSNGCQSIAEIVVPINSSTIDLEIGLDVYPIPAQNLVYIEAEEYQDLTYKLYDIKGNHIKTIKPVDILTSFDLSDIVTGVYALNVSNSHGLVGIKRIIKY